MVMEQVEHTSKIANPAHISKKNGGKKLPADRPIHPCGGPCVDVSDVFVQIRISNQVF